MTCPICRMPPIPPTQMRPGDLPICYNGHTLYRPFGVIPPPFYADQPVVHTKKRRPPDKDRGERIKLRALKVGITLSQLGKLCNGSDSIAYSAARGCASLDTFCMLEAKLDELEAEGSPFSPKLNGNFHC